MILTYIISAALLFGCELSAVKAQLSLKYGDVPLTPEQEEILKTGYVEKWKDGIVPYKIDCSIENLPNTLLSIRSAMRNWEEKTCIRFVERTKEKYFVTFFRGASCWGNVGQVTYSSISIGPGCGYVPVITHEIGHVIGMFHEQNRKDRDQYVEIMWNNILRMDREAFDIVKNTERLAVPYDYGSIMHYPWAAFSYNGRETIKPTRERGDKIPYGHISLADRKVTDLMYNCTARSKRRWNIMKNIRLKRGYHAKCTDAYRPCRVWASEGMCSRTEYVRYSCPVSCGSPECFDIERKRVKTGEETAHLWPNRFYLGSGIMCFDKEKTCPIWAKRGDCVTYPGWMLKNCRLSCRKEARCDVKQVRPPGKCNKPVGLSVDIHGNFKIPNSAFKAYSQLFVGGWKAAPHNARLYLEDDADKKQIGAWCSHDVNPRFIQIDLQRRRKLEFIATQGRYNQYERVSQFMIQYNTFNETYFETYKENGKKKVFQGNCDHVTPVLNRFNKPIITRHIRFIPVNWNWPCVRMEFYGC